jgi:hypothetical protein
VWSCQSRTGEAEKATTRGRGEGGRGEGDGVHVAEVGDGTLRCEQRNGLDNKRKKSKQTEERGRAGLWPGMETFSESVVNEELRSKSRSEEASNGGWGWKGCVGVGNCCESEDADSVDGREGESAQIGTFLHADTAQDTGAQGLRGSDTQAQAQCTGRKLDADTRMAWRGMRWHGIDRQVTERDDERKGEKKGGEIGT